MTATMKIELEGNYITLPYTSAAQVARSTLPLGADSTIINSLDSSSMVMTSPERTLSFAESIASTLPSSATSVRSSLEVEQQQTPTNATVVVPPGTTQLQGKLILTLSKPTKVSSLAICLNGSTHIAFLGSGKRSHYSRHHIRSQQFLIEPRPNSDQFTLLNKDTIIFPFSINIPNHLPSSVTTPQGGTIYRLTAVLTLAKSAGIMSFLSSGSTLTTSTVVQVYRESRSRCLLMEAGTSGIAAESGDDVDNDIDEDETDEVQPIREHGETQLQQRDPVDENDILPATVNHIWPGQLETTVTIPFTQLPSKSKPDLRLRVRVLRENLAIKSFQAALYERAIFRVQKAGAPAKSKEYIIGVRERVVSAQRCDAGWVNDVITGQVPHTFEKVVLFSIPNAVRSHNELYSSRACNASTYTSVSRLRRQRRLKEEHGIKDSEFGEVRIEIQHFIRYSVFVTGSIDAKGKTVTTPVERTVGDVPVIIHGLPAGPECDRTGLPTYLHSFSTSRVSYEEAQDYELEATGLSPALGIYHEFDGSDPAPFDGTGASGPIYGDYENDDAFMAIMGYRGSRTPPSYEESIGRPSLDASISDLQSIRISGLGINRSNNNSSSAIGLTR
ncbi:hypothetical protein BX616_009753 [Lobosporangium transversale]|uniref:Arrestin-like N-terminal domain-containing protein n=1 Tax=Lobosporangium transversale TaxID=64571 RepID=A0A1Y2G7S1_9FUNG|nr:hypothetical protein BCR41DRAFT_364787 [Lobosporangium transversale]KAF9913668.1 hypothetical protein BX616_009753 [Lobosporangium transversale]ORY97002.1 hypothetical protein BCR41DRAFT_364787 [Lobosporangium transversale]|eukprot:XP_021875564.1 hypothetical protein BCR41DRAFT_364787 [Lobosporangium transversale]